MFSEVFQSIVYIYLYISMSGKPHATHKIHDGEFVVSQTENYKVQLEFVKTKRIETLALVKISVKHLKYWQIKMAVPWGINRAADKLKCIMIRNHLIVGVPRRVMGTCHSYHSFTSQIEGLSLVINLVWEISDADAAHQSPGGATERWRSKCLGKVAGWPDLGSHNKWIVRCSKVCSKTPFSECQDKVADME